MPGREVVPLLAALAATTWWSYLAEAGGPPWHALLPLSFLAAAMPVLWRHVGGRRSLDLPILAFAGTSVWSAAIAFDSHVAIGKLGILAGGSAVAFALSRQPSPRDLAHAVRILAGVGAVLALYSVATRDWTNPPAKFGWLAASGRAVQAVVPPVPAGLPRLHPNVVGGMLAVLLPMSLAIVRRPTDGTRRPWSPAGIVSVSLIGIGLALSESRGAWLAVGACASAAVVWPHRTSGRRPPATLLVAAGAAAVFLLTAVIGSPRTAERLTLYSRSLALAADYMWTGAGLGTFPATYAVYGLLSPVLALPHSHNLYLDVAFEQGALGLALFVVASGLVVRLVPLVHGHGYEDARRLLAAALVSHGVLLAHGLVDDTLYASRGAWLLFVPAGVAAAAAARLTTGPAEVARGRDVRVRWRTVAAVSVLLVAVAYRNVIIGDWYANRGALLETRAELGAYDPRSFDAPTLDEVRRRLDLGGPMALFARALAYDAANRTASQRRLAILLSQGRDAEAGQEADRSRRAGVSDPVTRMLVGEALVAEGRVEDVRAILLGVDGAISRLRFISWYRYGRYGDRVRAADALAAALSLDPADRQLAAAAADARRAAEPGR